MWTSGTATAIGYPCAVSSLIALRRWLQRIDHERLRAFAAFSWRRFLADDCLGIAGSLSYTSLVALVPLTATVLGVVAMVPQWQHWGDALTAFLFRHLVPHAAAGIAEYVRTFAHSARGLTGLGAAGVLATSLLTMASIEDAFNRIWNVPTRRRAWARFLIYLAALLLGPLLGVASLAISSYVLALPAVALAEQSVWARYGLRLLPALLEWITFAAAYAIIPNRSVRWRHALAGGALAAALLEASKYAIALYLHHASYQQVYGALAAVPIFLLWIWTAWLVILLGATFCASLAAFRYQPIALRLPRGYEFYGLLRLLGRLAQARAADRGLHSAQLLAIEPIVGDALQQQLLGALAAARLVERAGDGQWRLLRDLDDIDLGELYAAVGLPIPLGTCPLPGDDDPFGRRARAALDALRLPLREQMRRSVGSIYPAATAAQSGNRAQ